MHFDMLELKPQQLYQYILSSFPSMAAGRAGQHRAGGPMSPWTQILQKRYKLALSCAQKLSLTTITTLRGASGPWPWLLALLDAGVLPICHSFLQSLFCQAYAHAQGAWKQTRPCLRQHRCQGGLVGVLNKQPSVIMLTFQWGPAPMLTQLVWGPAPMLTQLGLWLASWLS